MVRYYVISSGVHPSVCLYIRSSVPSSVPFPIDNLSICTRKFFKFAYILLSGMSGMRLLMGKNPFIFNSFCPCHTGKTVSGISFLYYLRYLSETSQLCASSNDTYCDKEPSLRLFQFMSYLPLISQKNVFDL